MHSRRSGTITSFVVWHRLRQSYLRLDPERHERLYTRALVATISPIGSARSSLGFIINYRRYEQGAHDCVYEMQVTRYWA